LPPVRCRPGELHFQEQPLTPPFTIEWLGKLYAPVSGLYLLGTEQIDTIRVAIDGRPLPSIRNRPLFTGPTRGSPRAGTRWVWATRACPEVSARTSTGSRPAILPRSFPLHF